MLLGSNLVHNAETVDDGSDNDSEADISELLLIPENPALVNIIYQALMECQVSKQ